MAWTDGCADLADALGVSPELAQRVRAVQPLVEAAALAENVDPDLINGVIMVESRFRPRAVSSAGAGGLMQLMPGTYDFLVSRTGIRGDRFDPATNIRLGTYYLRRLGARWGGREEWQLASYNAGAGAIAKHGPSFVRSYVEAVQRARDNFRAARLRCRGSALPRPQWGAKPSRPRPSSPALVPTPTPAVAAGGGVLPLLLLVYLATKADGERLLPAWL